MEQFYPTLRIHALLRFVVQAVEIGVVVVGEDSSRTKQRVVDAFGIVGAARAPAKEINRTSLVDIQHIVQPADAFVDAHGRTNAGLAELPRDRLGHLPVAEEASLG